MLSLTLAGAVLLGAGPSPSPPPPHPRPPDVTLPADTGRVLSRTYAGPAGARRYRLYLPPGAPAGRPLLVVLHGCTQTPEDIATGTRYDRLADARGVVVAYPEQPASEHPQRCWRWYEPAHQSRGAGEPAIIAGIAAEVTAEFGTAPTRTYLTGISAGGAMALLVAIAYPERFAAVGSHSGVPPAVADTLPEALALMQGRGGPPPALRPPPPPAVVFHGEADAVVRPVNAEWIAAQWGDGIVAEAPAADSGTAGGREFHRRRWRDAGGRLRLEVWTVAGLGHALSGGDPAGTFSDPLGPDAAAAMLDFLLLHRRGD